MRITINPDKKKVKAIKKALKENNGYCRCALIQNQDTKCQCTAFREQESGWCHCGLFYKGELNSEFDNLD